MTDNCAPGTASEIQHATAARTTLPSSITKECLHSTSMFETHFAIKNSRALGLEAAASAARQAARAATPAAVPMNSDAQGLN